MPPVEIHHQARQVGKIRGVAIAKEALETGRSVHQLALEKKWMSKAALDDLLKPENMTNPPEILH